MLPAIIFECCTRQNVFLCMNTFQTNHMSFIKHIQSIATALVAMNTAFRAVGEVIVLRVSKLTK